MTSAARILPPRSTVAYERALATALTDVLPVPLRDILNSETTPVEWLPFLAAHESADLWYGDWPAYRKRLMIFMAPALAALIGTSAAAAAFLPFVDAEIVQKVTHPTKFVVGRSALGLTPVGHRAFTTHFLVKVPLMRPANAFVVGRSAVQRAALRTLDREPLRRVNKALAVSKGEETAFSVNYGHRRPVTLDDGFALDGSFRFGDFTDRKRL